MAVYIVTILLAAFLLFQVQPIVAKMILPRFGGTSAVWSACMLFFQAGLLLGYLYAHWLHERLSARKQAVVHAALLAASLVALPLAPGASWAGGAHPPLDILRLLAAAAGLPYFMLATTSPLLQSWYARARAGGAPYRLFALSNLASLAALLSYPVLIEPHLATGAQGRAWSIGYACFAAFAAAAAVMNALRPGGEKAPDRDAAYAPGARPGWKLRVLWMALPACASVLLLAITNYLTQDVAAIPFLWIVPLAVYLASFIVCFEAPRLYARAVFYPLLGAALVAMAHMLWTDREGIRVIASVAIAASSLFVFSMVCHGELARLKPHPRYLTAYYLTLSAGGAAGGMFVGLIAPAVFNGYHELPLGLAMCAALAAWILYAGHRRFFATALGTALGLATLAALSAYTVWLGLSVRDSLAGCRVAARNFYGQLRVRDDDEGDGAGVRRKLLHGVINHGEQFLDADYRGTPCTYYCAQSGIGRAILAKEGSGPRRFGVLGLGSGTLTVYGRAGDVFRIYEINPLVPRLARSEFSYLRDTPAKVELVMGDGRLSLEREPDQHFDFLVMDAFSGDSVPVHLLTREAFGTYLRHLNPGGILAVNISNKYLDLAPVIGRDAEQFGKTARAYYYEPGEDEVLCFGASWVLVMDPATQGALGAALSGGEAIPARPGFRPWTDDFSDIFGILK
jgi:hypothetical protein